jgi:DNA gyrase subunit A
VDGQGNFGSVDGDRPAAYRYTEARLEALAEAMMNDPRTRSTTFRTSTRPRPNPPSSDGTPNLLVNGSTGIAVGMATNIPPHNLGEVIEGTVWLIENTLLAPADAPKPTAEQKLKEIMTLIPGPDFPTGGMIVGRRGIHEAYIRGRGGVQVRAKAEIEPMKKGDRLQIVITEIPYQVNKSTLLERIADLVREKSLEGISDIRDESDREGLRVVIELKRGEVGEVVLNNLYKHPAPADLRHHHTGHRGRAAARALAA